MKSVKRFFSTIAKKIGVDMMEDNEDLLKPFRPVKKDEQGPKADQQKAQRGTDSSHTEDLLTPFKDIKRGSRGSETQSTTQTAASVSVDHTNASPLSCIPASVRKKKYRKMEMEDRRRDNGEIDVSLRVQSAKDKPNDISSSSTHPLVDENKSVVRSVSGVSTLEDLSQSSLRRLRNMSERAVRKVKTFVSRPIKETTMKRFVNKVEARKQAEMTGQIMVRTVKRGDDVFPKQRLRKSQERCKSKENSFKMDTSIKSVYSAAPSSKYGDLPSGNRLVYGNKNNNGKLMVNDEPFWTLQRKPTEADLDESGTDDDLQLNADTALEVYEGKTKLENMPSIPIILDPMNELSELKRRDNLFYTKGVLFGNSVRSMINLCDTSFKATPIVRRRGRAEITFQEPEVMYSYLRERASETRKVPFKPGLAASSRRSRKARKRRSAPKCEGGTDDGGGGTGSSSTPSDNKSGKSSKKGNRLRDRLVQSALDSRGSGGGVKENDENQKIKPEQQLEPRSPIQAPVPIN